MKSCGKCKIKQPLSNFATNSGKPDGLQNQCKDCKKLYNQFHYLATKDKFNPARTARRVRLREEARHQLVMYLREHQCVDCGESDIVVLEFDHLRNKRYNIGDMVSSGYPWHQILAEIEKCEVVCANDHRRRTAHTFDWFKLNNDIPS